MTNDVFTAMVALFVRLLTVATSTNVVDIDLAGVHYTMSIFDCAVTFLVYDVGMAILAIPVQAAIGHELAGLEDAFIDD